MACNTEPSAWRASRPRSASSHPAWPSQVSQNGHKQRGHDRLQELGEGLGPHLYSSVATETEFHLAAKLRWTCILQRARRLETFERCLSTSQTSGHSAVLLARVLLASYATLRSSLTLRACCGSLRLPIPRRGAPRGREGRRLRQGHLCLPSPRLWVEGELLAPRAGAVGIPGLRAGVEGELPILGPRIKLATRKHLGVRLFGLVA